MARVINVRLAAREGHFFRCGHKWTPKGEDVSEDAFTKEQWERLEAEPRLVVGEPIEADDVEPDATEISEAIAQAIMSLSSDDFTDKGAAKVAAVKVLVAETYKDHVNGKAVTAVQAGLVGDGWSVPQKEPS